MTWSVMTDAADEIIWGAMTSVTSIVASDVGQIVMFFLGLFFLAVLIRIVKKKAKGK